MNQVEGRHWMVPIAQRAGLMADSAAALRPDMGAGQAWSAVASAAGLSDGDLAAKIAEVYRLRVADLHEADPLALRLVPMRTAKRLGVFPLNQSDHFIVVAASNPIDPGIEKELEDVTGRAPVFEIAAPRDIDAAIERHYPGEENGRPATGNVVLVADDDVVARTMAKTLLEKNGYTVIEATCGRTALARLADTEVSLVLLDQDMPEMSGLDVLRHIRRDAATATLPVVMLSIVDEVLPLEAGADDYIRKPWNPGRFIARVRAALLRAAA